MISILITLLTGIVLIVLFACWVLAKFLLRVPMRKNAEASNLRKTVKQSNKERAFEKEAVNAAIILEIEQHGIPKSLLDDHLYSALKSLTKEDIEKIIITHVTKDINADTEKGDDTLKQLP